MSGPEAEQYPPDMLRRYAFPGAVLDRLPDDVKAATDDDVRAVALDAEGAVWAGTYSGAARRARLNLAMAVA